MPRVRQDNDARYALRASFVDENGDILEGPIVIGGPTNDPRITDTQIANWDEAYSWGNHADAGYLTSYTEADTLATVTARGNSTSYSLSIGGLTCNGAAYGLFTYNGSTNSSTRFVSLTQAQYDSISKDSNTIYFIE